jgi:hypothetical protein
LTFVAFTSGDFGLAQSLLVLGLDLMAKRVFGNNYHLDMYVDGHHVHTSRCDWGAVPGRQQGHAWVAGAVFDL